MIVEVCRFFIEKCFHFLVDLTLSMDDKLFSFDWLNPFVVSLINGLSCLTLACIGISKSIDNVWSSVFVNHLLQLTCIITLPNWRLTICKSLSTLPVNLRHKSTRLMTNARYVWAYSSRRLNSRSTSLNLSWQMFLQSITFITFGSCWSEIVTHFEVMSALLTLKISRFFNWFSILILVMISTWRLGIADDRMRPSCISRHSETLITKLKMMTFQIILHLSIVLYIFASSCTVIRI